jgi:hypothetical protein
MGVIFTKLICKCGNVEDIKTDIPLENFEFKDCGDGTSALVCKNCNEVVYINIYIKALIC